MSENLDERIEMVNDFVTESREMLDEIEPQIIAMEDNASSSGSVDGDILNGIFRLFHSLKGMASFLDLRTVMTVTHEAETLLDIFRKNQMPLETKHVDLLYRTSDFIRDMLDNIEKHLDDGGHEDIAEAIIGEIQQTIHQASEETEGSFKEAAAAVETAIIPANNLDELKLVITPEMVKRFADEALEIFEEAEAALLQLEEHPDNCEFIEQVFRAFHSFKGNSGFFGYSDFEKISHLAESILDQLRDGEEKPTPETISVLLTVIDSFREGIQSLNSGEEACLPTKEKLTALLDSLKGTPVPDLVEITPEKPLNVIHAGAAEDNQAIDVDIGNGEEPAEKVVNKGIDCRDDGKKPIAGAQQAIRVDIDKLDSLLDLVGELVISEAMVSHNPDLQGLQLDRFDKAVLQLSKITREIQDVSMSMRMIPLAGTFRKMVRLVRDLSLKSNKKVNLEIIGEETEVDKTIIEMISDPLVHMIRNAVDHGLETPAQRLAAGKSETGLVTLEAKHSAGEVWIIVRDDGKGLNREKLLQKAKERGLLKEENRELKDEEVWKLIFEPGLSTAEQVSSISGRGVGMDVVRRNIEKLRGKIDIKSSSGEGTLVAIRIPLTLAIIEGMVIRVGHNRYTLPIISIKESIQPKDNQITQTPSGLEVVKIRQELLPVLRLHEMYKIDPDYQELTKGILIMVESNEKKCCLFVDELVGQQQIVIKGLSNIFGNIRGVSGCAILGDGEVSMILDVASLINSAEGLLEAKEGEIKEQVG